MKLCTLCILTLTQFAVADLPRDLVATDAIGIVSIRDGDTLDAILKSISGQAGFDSDTSFIEEFLRHFVTNPSLVDLSEEIVLVVEPGKYGPNQKPSGMGGPLPYMVLICKPKDGQTLELASDNMKLGVMRDGWFVAAGSELWEETKGPISPLLSKLPDAQVSSVINVVPLWTQYGPIARMVGGMMIGQRNKPGANGVIPRQRREQTSLFSNEYRRFMEWSSHVEYVTNSIDIVQYKLNLDIEVTMKDSKEVSIDNSSLAKMASFLNEDTIQYALNEKLTRKLLRFNFANTEEWIGNGSIDGSHVSVIEALKPISALQHGSVVAYGLNSLTGVNAALLLGIPNQRAFLDKLPEMMAQLTASLLSKFEIELTKSTESSNVWNVTLIHPDEVLRALLPKDDQIRFGKQGSDRIAAALGPPSWKPFVQSHSTPLSQLMQSHRTISIDFAMSFDARSIAYGMIDSAIASGSRQEEDRIDSSPSARNTFVLGTKSTGSEIHLQIDLLGLAKLNADVSAMQSDSNKSNR